ncbi:MAG: hypothetical protein HFJ12_06835 [Bacilli bacterium]|nr:hypothetical protein [Bacilli bacterium]
MNGKNYIILEIIPTAVDEKRGEIVQLSALKLNGLILKDRFDYRLNPKKILNWDIEKIISYDRDDFQYVNDSHKILRDFKKWVEDYDLLIIDNLYTKNYLKEIPNKKESIFPYLNMAFTDDVIERVIKKYQLEPSNHIVDLLYEALIYESNHK